MITIRIKPEEINVFKLKFVNNWELSITDMNAMVNSKSKKNDTLTDLSSQSTRINLWQAGLDG